MTTYESMELLGMQADRIDNLLGALELLLPASIHMQALKEALPGVRDALRRIYVLETGDDPWATHPRREQGESQ